MQLLTHVGGPVTTGGGARRTCRWYSSSACAARPRAAGGRVLSATVATQKGPGGATLSRGFGFVEFDSPATVGLDMF